MKRNFVVGLFGSFIGCGMLLIVLGTTGIAGARSVDTRPDTSQVAAVSVSTPLTSTFTYQGQLNNNGSPVTGSCQMAFRLYDDPAAATNLIGSPITTTVAVANGLFTVGLNFGSSAFDASGRWLDVRVNCGGGFTQLTPRQALTPVPYALAFGAPGSVSGYMVPGAAPGPYPTLGFNTYGTYPYYAGTPGYGGILQFQNGSGALWYATGTNVAAGAEHIFTPRVAIDANGNVGIGTTSPSAKLDVHASGIDTGVFGTSTNGNGVAGISTDFGTGVAGISTDGTGVYGASNSGDGVYGNSTSGVGVFGFSNSGNAGEFIGPVVVNGAMTVTGYLAKQGGGFLIDHPLDPANQYLNHSFVESPDMKDVYDGNVTLDAKGEATVILPDYFEALNRDFRYQLTALGAPGPNLYIAAEVKNNRFKIAGGTAGGKVSWQVTGIRHDPWAEQNRRPATMDKIGQEHGKYLYPQGYGQPDSLGINFEQRPALDRLAP